MPQTANGMKQEWPVKKYWHTTLPSSKHICCWASCISKQLNIRDALGLFREASKLQPKRAEPYFRTGETLATLGNLEQARVSLHKAITLNPDFATAYIPFGAGIPCYRIFSRSNSLLEKSNINSTRICNCLQ